MMSKESRKKKGEQRVGKFFLFFLDHIKKYRDNRNKHVSIRIPLYNPLFYNDYLFYN